MSPLLISLLLAGATPAVADDSGGLIRKICMSSFAAAMASAGKTAPDGMADFTCNCFLDEVNSGTGLDMAQSRCKSRAAAEFAVE
ncbi:hypothetical protein [Parasynechococcus sp.]|jgi:hypothetical protein|uniref:hypothetical protein n=1 Tax=Parasynechococcus sp. TaxID=3101203 RepID=UPI0037038996